MQQRLIKIANARPQLVKDYAHTSYNDDIENNTEIPVGIFVLLRYQNTGLDKNQLIN